MMLTVSSSCQNTEIETERARRLVLVLVGLLRQIEGIENGKLVLSWGGQSTIKWVLEAHGYDAQGLSTGHEIGA